MLEYFSELRDGFSPSNANSTGKAHPTAEKAAPREGGHLSRRDRDPPAEGTTEVTPHFWGDLRCAFFYCAGEPEIMQGSSKKILIVDDDPMILRLYGDCSGASIAWPTQAAAKRPWKSSPGFAADLVMLDIMMPGIDGYETCRRIRSAPFHRVIQVVMVSANSSRGEQVRAYAAGADDYMVKPFDPHELRSRVRLHFRLHGALETVAQAGGRGPRSYAGDADAARALFLAHAHDVTAAALTNVAELRDTETG